MSVSLDVCSASKNSANEQQGLFHDKFISAEIHKGKCANDISRFQIAKKAILKPVDSWHSMQKFCDIRACDNFLKDLEFTLIGKTRVMCNFTLI